MRTRKHACGCTSVDDRYGKSRTRDRRQMRFRRRLCVVVERMKSNFAPTGHLVCIARCLNMRLIDTHSLRLADFNHEDARPPYAILSHTWSDDETTDQHDLHLTASHERSFGYRKVVAGCAEARKLGIEWFWADTVCITTTKGDEELSVALNFMYSWYRDAAVCLVYLADVTGSGLGEEVQQQLRRSRWFTRGWTLQELIAPSEVLFFDRNWKQISYLRDCAGLVSRLTGIPSVEREGRVTLDRYTVAQRMSWASHRTTSRAEDRAYSLMGIFNVNMAIRYGEGGEKAFRRLQEHIFSRVDDLTIFAWDHTAPIANPSGTSSLFARSPAVFSGSTHIEKPGRPLRKTYRMVVDDYYVVPFYRISDPSDSWDDPSTADFGLLNCVDTRRLDEQIGLNLRTVEDGSKVVELRSEVGKNGRATLTRLSRV